MTCIILLINVRGYVRYVTTITVTIVGRYKRQSITKLKKPYTRQNPLSCEIAKSLSITLTPSISKEDLGGMHRITISAPRNYQKLAQASEYAANHGMTKKINQSNNIPCIGAV